MRNAEGLMRDLKQRTKLLALDIIRLSEKLPKNTAAFVLGKQVIRSATSIGANYRAACRARSRAEFISKLGIVEEEADETIYWLELLVDLKLIPADQASDLIKEANELTAIIVASIKTARRNS
jgi:four helix bundle protein